MTLDPLISVDDFTSVYPRSLTDAEVARLDYLLNSASSKVRGFCRRDFTLGTSTLRIKPLGDFVILPNPPIVSIGSVKRVNFDGTTTGFAGWAWDGARRIYGLSCIGSPMINAPEYWTDDRYTPEVEITYTHGSDEIPQEAIDRVVAMVSRCLDANQNDPSGSASETTTQSDTVGPFNRQRTMSAPISRVTPMLSPTDKQLLRDAGLVTRESTTVQLG